MTFLDLVKKRYSVRSFDPAREVEQDKLDYILECARLAPSAVNYQPWRFYVVRDVLTRNKLLDCYNREWVKSAPMFIVATVKHNESWKRSYDNKDHADVDVAIAVEHICLAASEQGLGTCWVCNFKADVCSDVLGLEDDEEAKVLIPIGYEKNSISKNKDRKSINDIVKYV